MFFIITSGFFLRFYGIWRHLPYGLNPDEPLLMREALRFGKTLNIGEFVKCAPFMILNFTILSLYYIVGKASGIFQAPVDIAVKFVRDPAILYFLIRTATSILSTFSILLIGIFTYRVFRRKRFFSFNCSLLLSSCFCPHREDNERTQPRRPPFLLAPIYLYTLYDEGGTKNFLSQDFLQELRRREKGMPFFFIPVFF